MLTDPLCSLPVRERIFRDITDRYKKEGTVFLKPHPEMSWITDGFFPQYPQFDAKVPMEVLNFFPRLRFKKAVAVLTEIKAIAFADEVVRLGRILWMPMRNQPFTDRMSRFNPRSFGRPGMKEIICYKS